MLTTDLCLAFNSNEKYDKCRLRYARDHSPNTKRLECNNNLIDAYGDLDPLQEPGCCTWMSFWKLRGYGNQIFAGDSFEMCGETFTQAGLKKGVWPSLQKCCKNAGSVCVNCDNTESPTGIAFTDMADFADNEGLFYRIFVEAWHMATENGLNLNYMYEELGPKREEVIEGVDTDCSQYPHWKCSQDKDCKTATIFYNGFFTFRDENVCINKHLPQSH